MLKHLKNLLFFLLSTIFAFCFSACNYNVSEILKPNNYITTFYGVITYEEFHNGLCVNIPNVGLCTIPSAKNIYSEITEEQNATLQSGDLIAISFEHGKEPIAIAESYPGQFIQKASFISIRAKNVSFSYLQSIDTMTASWCFTQARTTIFENVQLGDNVYFLEHGGKNGVAYRKLYTTATIGNLNETSITFYFTKEVKPEDFLENYPNLEQSLAWELI